MYMENIKIIYICQYVEALSMKSTACTCNIEEIGQQKLNTYISTKINKIYINKKIKNM